MTCPAVRSVFWRVHTIVTLLAGPPIGAAVLLLGVQVLGGGDRTVAEIIGTVALALPVHYAIGLPPAVLHVFWSGLVRRLHNPFAVALALNASGAASTCLAAGIFALIARALVTLGPTILGVIALIGAGTAAVIAVATGLVCALRCLQSRRIAAAEGAG